MPHFVLAGEIDCAGLVERLQPTVHRWGRAVLKTDGAWLRHDGLAALIEGVVVEFSRPLHPVAIVAHTRGETTLRLWSLAPVERTEAVQRWLALLVAEFQAAGAGQILNTNLPEALYADLGLEGGD